MQHESWSHTPDSVPPYEDSGLMWEMPIREDGAGVNQRQDAKRLAIQGPSWPMTASPTAQATPLPRVLYEKLTLWQSKKDLRRDCPTLEALGPPLLILRHVPQPLRRWKRLRHEINTPVAYIRLDIE